jgi:tetratricopeptide (TPR) repeat protein
MALLEAAGGADSIFVASNQQVQLESLAQGALSRGIERYGQGDYEGAIKEFRRSIGLSPSSQYAADAHNYMASAFIQCGETESAIKAYQASIRVDPNREDTHFNLGNLFFSLGRYRESIEQYKAAVRINPDANYHFALGQAYLYDGQYSEAETQFYRVRSLEPHKPNGDYGLGLTYSKQARYEDAIQSFEAAIRIKGDFYDAYAEIGYAYADLGKIDKATEQLGILEDKAPDLATTLSAYIYQVEPPKFRFAYTLSSFLVRGTPKTPVSALDSYLENANATRTFSMKIVFNKAMDLESVENRFNWRISRAEGGGPGEAYNFGVPIPATETMISPIPDQVTYDSDTFTATVYFTIPQNATADATIDPAHIEFKFSGKDVFGSAMAADGDQFTGFSGVA